MTVTTDMTDHQKQMAELIDKKEDKLVPFGTRSKIMAALIAGHGGMDKVSRDQEEFFGSYVDAAVTRFAVLMLAQEGEIALRCVGDKIAAVFVEPKEKEGFR